MKSVLILVIFTGVPVSMIWAAKALNWIVSNPTLYTQEVGFLPWLLIAFGIFITPKILNRKLK